eukprot:SM000219S06671  [mRNA]  locus=s219:75188:78808:+ [translate_table: standard]
MTAALARLGAPPLLNAPRTLGRSALCLRPASGVRCLRLAAATSAACSFIASRPFELVGLVAAAARRIGKGHCTRAMAGPGAAAAEGPTYVDHIVYMKVAEGTPREKVDTLITGLRALNGLDCVIQLHAGLAINSNSSYTLALHGRYRNRADLDAYAVHPEHVAVVRDLVKPIAEDMVTSDFYTQLQEGPVQEGVEIVHSFITKPKEGVRPEQVQELLSLIRKQDQKYPIIQQVSVGDNFNNERGKGYTIGCASLFSSLSDHAKYIEDFEQSKDEELFSSILDHVIYVDFDVRSAVDSKVSSDVVVPPPKPAANDIQKDAIQYLRKGVSCSDADAKLQCPSSSQLNGIWRYNFPICTRS